MLPIKAGVSEFKTFTGKYFRAESETEFILSDVITLENVVALIPAFNIRIHKNYSFIVFL